MLSAIIPDSVKAIVSKDHRELRERRFSFGDENPGKTVYIIRFDEGRSRGICELIFYVMTHIAYAEDKGYVPVVDFKNYYTPDVQNYEHRHKENMWDYFFDQPQNKITLDDSYKSKRVILSNMYGGPKDEKYRFTPYTVLDKQAIAFWSDVISRKIKFNSSMMGIINEKDIVTGKRVLGVSMRIAMSKGVVDHPLQASVEEYVKDIDELLEKWSLDYIFLSVDDYETRDYLIRKYRNKALYLERPINRYLDKNGTFHEHSEAVLPDELKDESGTFDFEQNAKNYLTEIVLLSRCTAYLGGLSGGGTAAIVFNNMKYENTKVYDKGLYRHK